MIKLELPIYQDIATGRGEKRKTKSVLIGLNWYRNAHYQTENKMKHKYHELVKTRLDGVKHSLKGFIKVRYKLYYKNSQSDLMNVISIIDKYFLDALQEIGIIENDNVKHYTKCEIEVAGEDKENPRVEITVEEIE